jgi:hypothetical protein
MARQPISVWEYDDLRRWAFVLSLRQHRKLQLNEGEGHQGGQPLHSPASRANCLSLCISCDLAPVVDAKDLSVKAPGSIKRGVGAVAVKEPVQAAADVGTNDISPVVDARTQRRLTDASPVEKHSREF